MEFVIFLLTAYGISNIIVYSSMFEWWRILCVKLSPNFLGELFQCMMCLPFWVGIILSIVVYSPWGKFVNSIYLSAFLDGCLTSGSVWLLHTIQEKLEK